MIGTTRVERDCPHCAEPILARAKVCKHCHRDVEPVPDPISLDSHGLDATGNHAPPEAPKSSSRQERDSDGVEAVVPDVPPSSRRGLSTIWRVAAVGLLVGGMTQFGRYGEFDAAVAVQLGAAAILATIDLRKRAGLR